jgi:hypothetical protein
LSAGSYGGNSGEKYYEGYSKQDKGFECIINNNNNNTNVVSDGDDGGNVTDGDGNETDTCEDCFLNALGPIIIEQFENYLAMQEPSEKGNNLTEYCDFIQRQIFIGVTPEELEMEILFDLVSADIAVSDAELEFLVDCFFNVFGGGTDNNRSLASFNTNTDTSASNINTDTSDFGPMMTLPTPTPSMETSDR